MADEVWGRDSICAYYVKCLFSSFHISPFSSITHTCMFVTYVLINCSCTHHTHTCTHLTHAHMHTSHMHTSHTHTHTSHTHTHTCTHAHITHTHSLTHTHSHTHTCTHHTHTGHIRSRDPGYCHQLPSLLPSLRPPRPLPVHKPESSCHMPSSRSLLSLANNLSGNEEILQQLRVCP